MVELWVLLSSIWPSLITSIGIAALISVDLPSQIQLPVPLRHKSCHRWSVMSTLHKSTLANREASFESRKASYESWKTSSKKQKVTFRAVDCFCKYLAHGFVVHKFLKVPGALLTHLLELHLGLREIFVQVLLFGRDEGNGFHKQTSFLKMCTYSNINSRNIHPTPTASLKQI